MQHRQPSLPKTVIALCCVLFFSCQKQYSIQLDEPMTTTMSLVRSAVNLQGNIYDEKGQPASGATVTVGKQVLVTDEKGYFRIDKAPLNGNAPVVTVEKSGYFKTFRSFRLTPGTNQVVIQLTKKEAAGSIAAATGGEVSLQNGSKVALAAGGVVNAATGAPYTGSVSVFASYIDPTSQDIGQTVPGSFMADDKDGNRVVLESFGMLAVELESASGEKLQIAPGKTATITTAIPTSLLSSAPAMIPLWYVDEKTGLWKEEGTATRSGNSYTGSVSHFTFWNVDKPTPGVQLTATFKTAGDQPLAGTCIRLSTKGAVNITGTVWTDSLGQINDLVPLGQSLLIEVLDPCKQVVYSESVSVVTGHIAKGTVRLPQNTVGLLTLKGKLTGCSAKSLNGFAVITMDNMVHYAAADAGGNFSTQVIACRNTNTVQVYGVDIAAFQRGSKTTVQAKLPLTDLGTIAACGTSLDEYVQYTLDGTPYNIADSIGARIMSAALFNNTFVANSLGSVCSFTARDLSFSVMIGNQGRTGLYSIPDVIINRIGKYRLSQASRADVNFTLFPQKANEYFEGTIDMVFTDTSQQQHTLKGKFRLIRNE